MSGALQTLNENSKIAEWAGRITERRNCGLRVREVIVNPDHISGQQALPPGTQLYPQVEHAGDEIMI